ncbi:MAG: hypothetical protein K8T10_11215 [Candidatus Eremiobacteraeota bacterium]|nr:hypothetical protein [Candidatus Eremiobacteraeota bacterium]
MRKNLIIIILTLVISLCMGLPPFFANAAAETRGDIELIEGSLFGIGDGFCFKFDKKGTPCTSFYDRNQNVLKYARVEKGRWTMETVAASSLIRENLYSSLAFDPANNPYIAFVGPDNKLKIAMKKVKKWYVQDVDNANGSGLYCDLFITSGGDPVISYQSKEGTMFAVKIAGSWKKEKIDDAGRKTIIFKNKSGNFCVYYIGVKGTETRNKEKKNKPEKGIDKKKSPGKTEWILKSAEKISSKWLISSIADSSGCIDFDAALDIKDSPVITYARGDKIKLYRETIPGSAVWKEEQVGTNKCLQLSLTLKKSGFPSVSYITRDRKELKVARYDGTKWGVKLVATAKKNYSFMQCQGAKDKNDRDLIILFDENSLIYFLQRGNGWGVGRIDGKSRVGSNINLAIDKKGKPAACYYDETKKELHYAAREGNKWLRYVVDSTGDVGKFSSLALGTDGSPFIAYYDAMRGDLKFAWKNGDFWKWERVDVNGDTGLNCSMTIGKYNHPHISYINKNSRYLKYAVKIGKKWRRERVVKLGEYAEKSVILTKPDGRPVIVYVDGHKAKKVSPGESPVRTSVRIATRHGKKKWEIHELAGPFAVNISGSALSADINDAGGIAISFLDREGKLQVLYFKDGQWFCDRFEEICRNSTSTKFQRDGSLKIVYITGKTRKESKIKTAMLKDDRWEISMVKLQGDRVGHISLGKSPDSLLRFAFHNILDSTACYFQQMIK